MGNIGAMAFVSYRSSRLSVEEKKSCIVTNGQQCDSRNKYYRKCTIINCQYRTASYLRERLHDNDYCFDSMILPPQVILPQGVLLVPHDFLNLMRLIFDTERECDTFIRLGFENHSDSFWTLLERKLWRYHSKENPPVEYHVDHDVSKDTYALSGPYELTPMSDSEKTRWCGIYMFIQPTPQAPGTFFGRYSRNCFLINCNECGNSFSISKKTVEQLHSFDETISCPYCLQTKYKFVQVPADKRWPWRIQQVQGDTNKEVSPIDPDDMVSLLFDDSKGAPKHLALYCLKDERFDTETVQTLKIMYETTRLGFDPDHREKRIKQLITKGFERLIVGTHRNQSKIHLRYYNAQGKVEEHEI